MEARRYTGLIVAVVLALVGTVAIIGYVNGAEKRPAIDGDTKKVGLQKRQITVSRKRRLMQFE